MKLNSSGFRDHDRIPDRFTCRGEDVSPPLEWSEMPEGTTELALTCEDPDAPGATFVHWVLWGLQPAQAGLQPGEVPEGARQGRNDFGAQGYRGPCPPPGHGSHHYHFRLYGLRGRLELPDGARIGQLRQAMEGKVAAVASLVGTYSR